MTDKRHLTWSLETEKRILYKALLTRRVEERLLNLYKQAELHGTIHTCIGQEFTGAVISEFIRKEDSVFSNHRCHGHYLSITNDVAGLMAEVYGKKTGASGGKGGSQHLCKENFYSNGIQGGMVPVAAGMAMSKKIKNKSGVCFVWIGDGTLGEGVLYETLNLISKWCLPLIVLLENNGYAQSTGQQTTLAGSICGRAEAFGIKTAHANTWDYAQLYEVAGAMIHATRVSGLPCFLQIDTYRLSAHSKGDDHRDQQEIEHYQAIDPLNIALKTRPMCQDMLSPIDMNIDDAVIQAKAAPLAEDIHPLLTPLVWQIPPVGAEYPATRLGFALNTTFKELMQYDEKIYFIGEDVCDPYGGAFKISQGLSDLFPDRVLNTPISEGALVGLGNGLALEGYRPIIEIMFGDFITLTLDQIINHAAKFRYMYNHQVRVPIIIRTPMGGGRGYGPTHSQTLDRHVLGIPGLRVMALCHLVHPRVIYAALLRSSEDPAIVIENKLLYTTVLQEKAPRGFLRQCISEPFPLVVVEPESSHVDITIIAYGGMSVMAMEALETLFIEHDLIGQLICPLQIYPFDISSCHRWIQRGRRLVLIEEGQGYANFSAELIAQCATTGCLKGMEFTRIASRSTSIPASKNLETEILIQQRDLIDAIVGFTQKSGGTSLSEWVVYRETGAENPI